MDCQKKAENSYNIRASYYEKKTNWVNNDVCIKPFAIDVFGSGLAFDACSGTGAISKSLLKKGWNVLSYDLSKTMLQQNNLPFPIIGDINSIPTLDNHFDLVVCRQGLQYSKLDTAINELIRICNGKLIFGHITREVGDNSNFWKEYFEIASPGRRHIFRPGELEEVIPIDKSRITKKIVHQIDWYSGPLLHLTEDERNRLISMLQNTSEKFKNLYNVTKINEYEFMYSNRWEFLTIDLN